MTKAEFKIVCKILAIVSNTRGSRGAYLAMEAVLDAFRVSYLRKVKRK